MITKRTPATGRSITSAARPRSTQNKSAVLAANLTPAQKAFVGQLQRNYMRNKPVMAATNTANIMARPDFLELLPLFVQKLVVLDVFGSVAMKTRQQLIPYFKVVAENTKGETKAGQVLNSPFANRQGLDANFSGRAVKNEEVADSHLAYTPVLPGTVTIRTADAVVVDKGDGQLYQNGTPAGTIDYCTGYIQGVDGIEDAKATYQYDNETVGPDENGSYGAKMGKIQLQLDEFNLTAEAHELACYWSIYSAFAAQQEYGTNIGDMAKEAAISEITAEINSACFADLARAASYRPQFNWDASPVLAGSVVPSDYLNMFKLKLGQAAASVYQQTRTTRPNRLVVGTTAAEYIGMIDSFKAAAYEQEVGPYKFGTLDQFEVYVDPNYDPDQWVMCSKNNDLRKCSAVFGEYMPLVDTGAIQFPNLHSGTGVATMYGKKIILPESVVSGKITGTF